MSDNEITTDQLMQIVDALGLETIHESIREAAQSGDEETSTLDYDENSAEDNEFENLEDPDEDDDRDFEDGEVGLLEAPWPVSVVGEPIRHQSTDGSIYIDVTIEFNEVEGADDYQIRIVPA